MTAINKSALIMHTPDKMYHLVNAVEFYPEFLPWCRSSRVIERDDTSQLAEIEVAKGPLNKTFRTRNTMVPDARITLDLDQGPFSRLHGEWVFQPLGDRGCKIMLDIDFAFSNRLMSATLNPVFSEICATLVDAFVKRADAVYGN
ncbi:MAG TPA: ubiquinone-binding protein [Gammaproteobacteria bacterium]|jgi:ribosome-associated toxin RatA of RatAB toxin-antitoxin module|nr:ubiquinone-binding protein [Gammaproteobacteria bacterium]